MMKSIPMPWSLVFGLALAGLGWFSVCAAEEGLVAFYPFDKGQSTIAVDRSGKGNNGKIIGGAKQVKGPYGSALELDGRDGFVDCGAGKSLNIASAGTVMAWFYAKTAQGGLVNWSTGDGWKDERLVLAINTWRGRRGLLGCMSDGEYFSKFRGLGTLETHEWLHIAYTFDGRTISVYRDGLRNRVQKQSVRPSIKKVSLWLGRCLGLGKQYFHGLLDQVRIYNRPLSSIEIIATYRREAKGRNINMSRFRKVGMETRVYPLPGKILVTLDARGIQPLSQGSRIVVQLHRPRSRKPLRHAEVIPISADSTKEAVLDVRELSPGKFELHAEVIGTDGARIGEASTVTVEWPGQPAEFKSVKILNNLCWELLNVRSRPMRAIRKRRFKVPIDRWVFIRSVARVAEGSELWISIDSGAKEQALVTHSEQGESTLEAMRFLKAGQHTVHIGRKRGANLEHLVVRAVPMLQHAFYGANPHIQPYGPYDWEFLKKDVLPNINTMISHRFTEPLQLKEWKATGKHWITSNGVPKERATGADAVEKVYRYWARSLGLRHPLMDGVIIDEFGGGDEPVYDVYRQAVEQIYANPEFKGKAFMPYTGSSFFQRKDRGSKFARACIDGGGFICWERYLQEQPTESAARAYLKSKLTDKLHRWQKSFPDVAARVVVVYGIMSQPTESLNVDPTVDFKVFMDMEIRHLANHPAFFGLGGIQEYHSSYSDEENVRWAGRLYRHYAIEGESRPLTNDPYELTHLQNPDFENGTAGWNVSPAVDGSIQIKKHAGYSWLEGRYPRTPKGDIFLWMKRSAGKPNRLSQEIRNLTPGRLYSLKIITADYQDLVREQSSKKPNAVSIRIDNVDLLPGPKKSFQFTFPNCYAHHLGKFNASYNYWMNYHWRVFRAKAATARIEVTDWKSETDPGGPAGQELIINFIELQPYIGE